MSTLVQASREAIEDRKERVLKYVKLTEEYHNQMLFDYGMAFLTTTMRLTFDDAQEIATTKVYWNWFKLQWSNAQASYLLMRETFVKVSPTLEHNLYTQHMRYTTVESPKAQKSFNTLLQTFNSNELPKRSRKTA